MSDSLRLKAALFVDFDNVYIGLQSVDAKAAELFATDPGTWMAAVTGGDGRGGERRFLIRNCYLNPSVFSKYRAYWTRAGFRVIDCPSLTQQGKSSTDINLVLDAVDVLADPVGVDEFFIASADADFTSLVQRIRAADRETTVIVAGAVASAYRSMADHVVQSDDLLELIGGAGLTSTAKAPAPLTPAATSAEPATVKLPGDARSAVRAHLAEAPGPVTLAILAHRARTADASLDRDWAPYGSFRSWLEADGDGIGTSSATPPGYAWDESRFSVADVPRSASTPAASPALSPLEEQVVRVTDIPRLTAKQYGAVIESIAADLATHPFVRNESAKRVRDACAATGDPVSRTAIDFIVSGLLYAAVPMAQHATAKIIAEGWTKNAEALCRGARIELNDDDLHQLRSWVSGGLVG